MNYRADVDLAFLQYCENSELKILAQYLSHDKTGAPRLTSELENHPDFTIHEGQPDQYVKAWKLIAAELQHFGGDTILNLTRGNGILYKEILCEVCDKLKVNYNKEQKVFPIETSLFQKLVEDSWEKMTPEQRKELLTEIGVDGNLGVAAGLGALQGAIRVGGFAAYKISLVVANTVAKAMLGKGLAVAANAGLMRGIAVFAGPIGLALTTLLTIPSITGTAYRVTIPSVIQVAHMRRTLAEKKRF